MPDVDHVVELDAIANRRGAKCGSIDGRVGSDFDIVADESLADLWKLIVMAAVENEAKAVGSEDSAGVNDNARADFDVGIDGDVGMDHGVWPNVDMVADAGAGGDGSTFAYDGVRADNGKWTYRN